MIDLYKPFVCPFCGSTDFYKNYLIRQKDGYNRDFMKCRICNERMRLNILTANFTAYDWGLWLALNIEISRIYVNKFKDKIHFKILYANLDIMEKHIKREFKNGYYYIRNSEETDYKKMLSELNYKLGIWVKHEKKITLNDFNT